MACWVAEIRSWRDTLAPIVLEFKWLVTLVEMFSLGGGAFVVYIQSSLQLPTQKLARSGLRTARNPRQYPASDAPLQRQ